MIVPKFQGQYFLTTGLAVYMVASAIKVRKHKAKKTNGLK